MTPHDKVMKETVADARKKDTDMLVDAIKRISAYADPSVRLMAAIIVAQDELIKQTMEAAKAESKRIGMLAIPNMFQMQARLRGMDVTLQALPGAEYHNLVQELIEDAAGIDNASVRGSADGRHSQRAEHTGVETGTGQPASKDGTASKKKIH